MGLSEGDPGYVTAENYKNDLVLYFGTDSYANSVKPYVEDEDGSYEKMIGTVEGTAIDTWLAANPARKVVSVEQRTVDYTNLSEGIKAKELSEGENIEPNSGTGPSTYFQEGVNGGILRYNELYQIVYTVEDENGNKYVASRNVKLRYRIGDVDISAGFSGNDTDLVRRFMLGQYRPFLDESGNNVMALVNQVMDTDLSNGMSGNDRDVMRRLMIGEILLPEERY